MRLPREMELEHMEAMHSDVITDRMLRAGYVLEDGRWVDNLCSHPRPANLIPPDEVPR